MAKSLTLTLLARLSSAQFTDDFGGGPTTLPDVTADLSTSNGTGDGQADVLYVARRTVASSASPDSLDLNGGTLYGWGPNGSNTNLTFAKLVAMLVVNQHATAILTVGGGSNAVAGIGTRLVGPTDVDLLTRRKLAGIAVTAGTGDIIRVATDSGTNVPYDIVLVGRSA